MNKSSNALIVKSISTMAIIALICACADERGFRPKQFPQPTLKNQNGNQNGNGNGQNGNGNGNGQSGNGSGQSGNGNTPPPPPPAKSGSNNGGAQAPAQNATGSTTDQLIDQTAGLISEIGNPNTTDSAQLNVLKQAAKASYLAADKVQAADQVIKGISINSLGNIDATSGMQNIEVKAILTIDGKDQVLTADGSVQWGVDPDPTKIMITTQPLTDLDGSSNSHVEPNLVTYAYFCNDASCKMDKVLRVILQIPQANNAAPIYALLYQTATGGPLRSLDVAQLPSFDDAMKIEQTAAQAAAAPAPTQDQSAPAPAQQAAPAPTQDQSAPAATAPQTSVPAATAPVAAAAPQAPALDESAGLNMGAPTPVVASAPAVAPVAAASASDESAGLDFRVPTPVVASAPAAAPALDESAGLNMNALTPVVASTPVAVNATPSSAAIPAAIAAPAATALTSSDDGIDKQ